MIRAVERRLRVFAFGGLLSYRALFGWVNPYVFIGVMVIPDLTQIVFFAYLGRATGIGDDTFFLVGNALVAAAIPGLFGMADTISDERRTHTLSLLVVSPASRLSLFLGRALPIALNGVAVSVIAFAGGSLILGVKIPLTAIPALVVVIAVTAFACTGLGLVNASIGLRQRESATISNLIFYFLLLAAGVNVPLALLPDWLATIAQGLPVTHGAEAARELVAGARLADVAGLLGAELLIGAAYALVGLAAIRAFELQARRGASLELA
ncbi:MAG: ABC transporter permease [Thermoleophilia bacterium]|nr:ABC transporter permease [Thermoleophilia bacterium]